jgi:hypothetical protein
MSCTGTNLFLPVIFRTCFLIPVDTYFTICFQNVPSFCYWFRFSFQTYVLISFQVCCLIRGLQSVFLSLHYSPQSGISLCYITTEDAVRAELLIPTTKK